MAEQKPESMLFPLHIGFVSTRFAGTDGVSLESAKWAQVLWEHQHLSYWYGGKLDRDPVASMLVPEAFFEHPENVAIHEQAFGRLRRSAELTRKIGDLAALLKRTLYDFVERFAIDVLVVENALCIPLHLPLGVALTHFIAETGFPVIAHHHDFYWERSRFAVNAVGDYLQMAFPPALPMIQHVTINTFAQQELAHRKGCPPYSSPTCSTSNEARRSPTTTPPTFVARSASRRTISSSSNPRESSPARASSWRSTSSPKCTTRA
ncbi:MAG: hypothetical protein ACYC35_21485 [Pirellulales bacterium]